MKRVNEFLLKKLEKCDLIKPTERSQQSDSSKHSAGAEKAQTRTATFSSPVFTSLRKA